MGGGGGGKIPKYHPLGLWMFPKVGIFMINSFRNYLKSISECEATLQVYKYRQLLERKVFSSILRESFV